MKIKLFKKPHQLPLASMSENFKEGNVPKKSGKHRSQEMQKIMAKARNVAMRRKKKQGISLLTGKKIIR